MKKSIKASYLAIYMALFMSISCSSSDNEFIDKKCTLVNNCLNSEIFNYFNNTCINCKEEGLSTFLKEEYDQLIFIRKFQFDVSKQCGNLNLSLNQQKLFNEDCDYILASKNKNLVSYIKGSCFSPSIPETENIYMFDVKTYTLSDGTIDNLSLLNQNISTNSKIFLYNNDGYINTKINSMSQLSHEGFDCFTSFDYESP